MKILIVVNWIKRLLAGLLQKRGDEIKAKGDAIKVGNGSSFERVGGNKTILYNPVININNPNFHNMSPYDLKRIKDEIDKKLEDFGDRHPSIDKSIIDISSKVVASSSSADILTTAIPTISGMLSESSQGKVTYGEILNYLGKPLSEYGVEYQNPWVCSCGNINFLDVCAKCKKERFKRKI